jgi:hypothetical protein
MEMKNVLKKLTIALIGMAAMLGAAGVQAIPLTWTLTDAVFNDQTTASGSFTYDATLDVYSNWNITVQNGTLSAFNYDTSNSQLDSSNMDSTGVLFVDTAFDRYINFNFASALTDAGGTVSFDFTPFFTSFDSGSWECGNCSPVREFVSGAVTTATSVPEPSTLLLLGTLLLGAGFVRRRVG